MVSNVNPGSRRGLEVASRIPHRPTHYDPGMPDLSIVIPARDEETELPGTLASIAQAVAACDIASHEVIVVDDGSTDATAPIARDAGARVVSVRLHNIGAVRNAGAAVATGEMLIFLDADTRLPADVLRAALGAIASGAVGGGAGLTWDRRPPLMAAVSAVLFVFAWQRIGRWATGCFLFCRREAFEAVGGFNSEWFAAEERAMSIALREHGRREGMRWVILREKVVSSARKLRLFSTWELIGLFLRTIVSPRGLLFGGDNLKSRDGLSYFYDAPREASETSA